MSFLPFDKFKVKWDFDLSMYSVNDWNKQYINQTDRQSMRCEWVFGEEQMCVGLMWKYTGRVLKVWIYVSTVDQISGK